MVRRWEGAARAKGRHGKNLCDENFDEERDVEARPS